MSALAMAAVLVVMAVHPAPTRAQSSDRIGLHVTQSELDVWRTRAEQGPFKNREDVGYRTPGDWSDIKSHADAFLADPSDDRFVSSYYGSGCIERGNDPTLDIGLKLRDAAFYAMVKQDATYREAVVDELLWQANEPSTDFSDGSFWCTDPPESLGGDGGFIYAEWMTRLLLGYDYIRPDVSQSTRETLDRWFLEAGNYFRQNVDNEVAQLFDDRSAGILSSAGERRVQDVDPDQITHHGGWQINAFHRIWNNRRSTQIRLVAFVGIQQQDATLQGSAKQWVKDVLKYGFFPDGTPMEYHRSHGREPFIGWGYATVTASHLADIANHFARAGDTGLFEYSTSDGVGESAGGPKTIRLIADHVFSTMDGSKALYNYTGTDGAFNDRLDGYVADEDRFHAYDVWFAGANNYWQDDSLRKKYLEIGPEYIDLEERGATVKNTGPHMPWGGSGDVYPGVMFMFADMEDKVDPYDGSTSTTSPSADEDQIVLAEGWNLVGSSIDPSDTDLDVILKDIKASLALFKDEGGNVYIPDTEDEILDWSAMEGYKLYITRKDTLSVSGDRLDASTSGVWLEEGWNYVPYYPDAALPIAEALADISDSLVLVKDEDGNSYLPAYDIDEIGEMVPNHAYMVYVSQKDTLNYP